MSRQKLTRNNIAYNLNISPHKLTIAYEDFSLEYVFSSDLYKRKFEERYKANRTSLTECLLKRYGCDIRFHILSDLKLYNSIEKRGFLLRKDGCEAIECLSKLKLDGVRMTLKP